MGQEVSQINIGKRVVVMKDKLGEGGYSFVYLVEDSSTGEQFALKRCIAADANAAALAEKVPLLSSFVVAVALRFVSLFFPGVLFFGRLCSSPAWVVSHFHRRSRFSKH